MIRDNDLKDEDKDGRKLTANEQLELKLSESASTGDIDAIRLLLKRRDCFLFPKPTPENLENLDSIPIHELNPKF